jgi:pimeloyl-ACP methyl ester carboxylesterase
MADFKTSPDEQYVARFGEPPRSLHVEVNGARLHLLEWGASSAQPVLLVHGMRAHARWFTAVGPALARHYRALAVDLRGHGRSAHAPPYGIGRYADDVAALVNTLELTRPILLGHSMGGGVVAHAAARLESRLSALVLVDAGLSPPPRPNRPRSASLERDEEREPAAFQSFEQVRARFKLRPGLTVATPELLDHLAYHAIARRPDGSFGWRSDPNLIRQSHLTPPPHALDATGVVCPVLSFWGAHSPLLERVNPLDFAKRFPNAVVTASEMIPGAYHHVFLDQAEAFNAALLQQLALVSA